MKNPTMIQMKIQIRIKKNQMEKIIKKIIILKKKILY